MIGGSYGNMDINSSLTAWEFFEESLLEYTIGDVDFNNRINIYDILMVSDYLISNSSYVEYLMDFNNDQSVDFNDILSIIVYILYS